MELTKYPLKKLRPHLWLLMTSLAIHPISLHSQQQNDLVKNSPFLPPGYGEKAPEPAVQAPKPVISGQLSRELEFRGVFKIGEAPPKFSIFDKKENKGSWMHLNDSNDRFKIVEYNAPGTIVVEAGGQREEIKLSNASDKPLPIAGMSSNNRDTSRVDSAEESESTRRRVIPRRRIIRRRTTSEDSSNSMPPPPPPRN